MYNYRIEHLQEVLNGDELKLVLDLGFRTSMQVHVWLNGILSPRSGQFDRTGKDLGRDSREFTVKWFAEAERPWNVQVIKESQRRGDDVYLVDIYDANGNSLGEALVDNKMAEIG